MFFTHPRNAGRHDLGCPFGCREAHRRQNAIRRSTEYYRTKEGKAKKRDLNAVRCQQKRLSEESCKERKNDYGKYKIDDATMGHIQLVTSLVEDRWVEMAEIYTMLSRLLRQHSIDLAVKLPYGAQCRKKNPP